MQKVNFSAYGIASGGYAPGALGVFDHTFVLSSLSKPITTQDQVIDNWNCWGRGKEIVNNGTQLLSQGSALAEWARLIYGNDPSCPTGLIEKIEGVCHNAANRLLVLAGADVSAAHASIYTTLLYGKYGFHVEKFLTSVKEAANNVNQTQPGAISDADLQTVLSRIAVDPSDELGTLESHFVDALPQALSSEQKDQLLSAYQAFQARREELFEDNWKNVSGATNRDAYQQQYAKQIAPLFGGLVQSFYEILGPDDYNAIFKLLPDQVKSQIVPLLLKTQ
jgi:hypothetical protein